MQKTTLKASILIWSIFLSLIISVTFIWISTKINQNLNNNNDLNKNIQIQNEIKNKLKSKNYSDKNFDNWYTLIFASQKNIKIWLKKDENIFINFPETSTWNISIINWWPIYYSWSIWTWIINNTYDINSIYWMLNIKNLWWYTKIQLDSNNNIQTQYQNYKIVKTIWNKKIIKTSWKVQNF